MHTTKRQLTLPALSLLAACGGFSSLHSVAASEKDPIALSYSADGKCYCTSSTTSLRDIDTIIPTPVGGQTVVQICQRLGAGPGLRLLDGQYNHPAYSDAQCGNGPTTAAQSSETCTGMTAPGKSECGTSGPKWDLVSAYSGSETVSRNSASVAVYQAPSTQNESPDVSTEPGISASPGRITNQTKSQAVAVDTTSTSDSSTSPANLPARSDTQHIAKYITPPKASKQKIKTTVAQTTTTTHNAIPAEPYKTQSVERKQPRIDKNRIIGTARQASGEFFSTTETVNTQKPISEPSVAAAKSTTDQSAAVSGSVATESAIQNTTVSAVRRPKTGYQGILNYQYVDVAPVSYDFGGAGLLLEGSATNSQNMTFLGRAGVADEYSEFLLGVGFILSPFANRNNELVFNVGIEYGFFDLGITDIDDIGGYLASYIRSRLAPRFELQSGVSYSSFFDGDIALFGAGSYQFTPQLSGIGKVELGDNDQVSFGIRYFY